MSKNTLQTLVEMLLTQREVNFSGDTNRMNILNQKCAACVQELFINEGSLVSLLPLLSHESIEVRVFTAAALLASHEEQAQKVLEECSLSEEKSLAPVEAQMILLQLKQGTYNKNWWKK